MPKIVYLVSEDWFFCSHFLPMARAARDLGCEVVVAARVRAHRAQIEAEGFRVVALESERRSLDPRQALATVWRIVRLLRDEKPDLVHVIALRTVLVGGLAARLAGCRRVVLAPTGLGHLWVAPGSAYAVMRWLVRRLVGTVLATPGTRLLFENLEDPPELGLDPGDPRIVLVGGAGIDPAAYRPSPEPPGPVRVAVVARMVEPKGIATAVEAMRRVRQAGQDAELHLFGAPDPSNRRSIAEEVLQAWSREPGIAWHGPTADVAGVWAHHHVAMLLSDREGLPRSLVEAMACGRPVIASDVPGCRTLVRHGVDGLLVPAGDSAAAAAAISALAADPAARARMGAAGRARVEAGFSERAVAETVSALYRAMLAGGAGQAPAGGLRAISTKKPG